MYDFCGKCTICWLCTDLQIVCKAKLHKSEKVVKSLKPKIFEKYIVRVAKKIVNIVRAASLSLEVLGRMERLWTVWR